MCCAINDSAKSGHSIKEGIERGGWVPALRILLLMGREKLDVCAGDCQYLCCVNATFTLNLPFFDPFFLLDLDSQMFDYRDKVWSRLTSQF